MAFISWTQCTRECSLGRKPFQGRNPLSLFLAAFRGDLFVVPLTAFTRVKLLLSRRLHLLSTQREIEERSSEKILSDIFYLRRSRQVYVLLTFFFFLDIWLAVVFALTVVLDIAVVLAAE